MEKYYIDDSAKIERVEFEDGTAWDANDFILARITSSHSHGSERHANGEGHLTMCLMSPVEGMKNFTATRR